MIGILLLIGGMVGFLLAASLNTDYTSFVQGLAGLLAQLLSGVGTGIVAGIISGVWSAYSVNELAEFNRRILVTKTPRNIDIF